MKFLPRLFAITSIFAATSAIAGPPVTVTFKNQGTAAATYTIVTSNESSTYTNASPKPATTVPAGGNNVYTVTSLISPDVNYASVRYKIGSKQCEFYTSFTNTTSTGGTVQWSKTATPSGGATCTATITSTNLSTYAWTVDFVMK